MEDEEEGRRGGVSVVFRKCESGATRLGGMQGTDDDEEEILYALWGGLTSVKVSCITSW